MQTVLSKLAVQVLHIQSQAMSFLLESLPTLFLLTGKAVNGEYSVIICPY